MFFLLVCTSFNEITGLKYLETIFGKIKAYFTESGRKVMFSFNTLVPMQAQRPTLGEHIDNIYQSSRCAAALSIFFNCRLFFKLVTRYES